MVLIARQILPGFARMIEIVVLTLFESMFRGVLEESILMRAQAAGLVKVRLINFRDFTADKHRTVDDATFGGGAGLVLKPDPIFAAMETLEPLSEDGLGACVLLSPQGRVFSQELAEKWATYDRVVLICGHYEGFDERISQGLHLEEVSLGDFVLTGGEIPAMAIIDALVRLLPGALGNDVSHEDDSFSTGLLEYPQYTRPASFRGLDVPPTLLSGDHGAIARWRRLHALYRTWARRPDLLATASLDCNDREAIARFERGDFTGIDVSEEA